MSENSVGILGSHKNKINIHNSTISNNNRGIIPAEAAQVSITGSTLSGNNHEAVTSGIGHYFELKNSTVRDNGAGICTGEGTFVDNTISNNDGYGIQLVGLIAPGSLGESTIVGNEIRENGGAGINFVFSSGVVQKNTISNNQTGILPLQDLRLVPFIFLSTAE